jgi:hypothetical protein
MRLRQEAKASVVRQVLQILSALLERLIPLGARESARAQRELREILPLGQEDFAARAW